MVAPRTARATRLAPEASGSLRPAPRPEAGL